MIIACQIDIKRRIIRVPGWPSRKSMQLLNLGCEFVFVCLFVLRFLFIYLRDRK